VTPPAAGEHPRMLIADLPVYAPDLEQPGRSAVAVYVATHLLEGRSLFAILADRFVTDRLDEHPFLLDDLARDPVVRGIVTAAQGGGAELAGARAA